MKLLAKLCAMVVTVASTGFVPTSAQRLALIKTEFIGGTHYGAIAALYYQAIPTRDKGIIVASVTLDSGTGDIPHPSHPYTDSGDVILIKLDSNGNKQWVRTFGTIGQEGANSICQISDGGFGVLTCTWNRRGDFHFDKIDEKGNYLWSSRNLGSSQQEGGTEILSTPDHGFLMAGNSMGADGDIPYNYGGAGDWVLIKTDSLGNKQWTRVFGTTGNENEGNISVASDGTYCYAAAGCPTKDHDCVDSLRMATGFIGNSPYIFKVDASGNKLWAKTYGIGVVARTIFDWRDSTIVVVGQGSPRYEFQSGLGDNDIALLKLDRDGNFKWGRLYGGSDYDDGTAVCLAPNGGYYLSGFDAAYSGRGNGWLILTDSVGNVVSENNFGDLGEHGGVTGVATVSDGVVVIGHADSYKFTEGTGHNYHATDTSWGHYYPVNLFVSHFQFWPTGVSATTASTKMKLYPNPASKQITIVFPTVNTAGRLSCADANGCLVFEHSTQSDDHQISIDTSNWVAGIYFLSWQTSNMQSPVCAKLLVR